MRQSHAPRERVSWNFFVLLILPLNHRHAPRERVSWNDKQIRDITADVVTLHVSVWVEIYHNFVWVVNIWSRSTWACELKSFKPQYGLDLLWSRSTWACELKWNLVSSAFHKKCHAPRERVSWNCQMICLKHELLTSRSTWACELKFTPESDLKMVLCHAPRERVSWNEDYEGI